MALAMARKRNPAVVSSQAPSFHRRHRRHRRARAFVVSGWVVVMALGSPLWGQRDADYDTLGGTASRNMAVEATGLPEGWDLETGKNVKWVVELGSEAYGGPVVAGGKVFVGTNNERPRNPRVTGDRGVLLALRESDGGLLWQATHRKLETGALEDWPLQGVCSTPTVDGERLYYVSNRGELVCLDTEGFRDGENDGPFRQEPARGKEDADVVWRLDMRGDLGVVPRNMSASSPLVVGDLVFTLTSNGLDDEGRVPAPRAPSFLAVERKTGRVVWSDASPGGNLLDGQWSSPTFGVVDDEPQVLFPGGDGWLYAFKPGTGDLLWRFNGNAALAADAGPWSRNAFVASAVLWQDRVYIAVGRDPEQGAGQGHLWALDATGRGDLSPRVGPGEEASSGGVVWHFTSPDFARSLSTVAISDGLLYTADLNGFVYALDVESGQLLWTYDALAPVWGSPRVADGKVYVGDADGDVVVLREGRKREVLAEVNMEAPIHSTIAARNGVLYVMTAERLFALALPALEE